jgi:hypothetical protein
MMETRRLELGGSTDVSPQYAINDTIRHGIDRDSITFHRLQISGHPT